MKYCSICKKNLDLSAFGVSRRRYDGLGAYCRACTTEKVRRNRELRREKEAARIVPRKICQPAIPIWRLELKPRDAVLMAIRKKARDEQSIQEMTRLKTDDLYDALADLYAEGKLDRNALKRREYRMAA